MPDIFLSYSRDDQATARRFAEGFERAGFSVWWDQALNPGEAFDKVTEKALEDAAAVVVLWSKRSVDSRWVRAEATQANSSGKLVPVMIEPCKRPIMFELTHTADLSGWKGDTNDRIWQEFTAGMRRFAEKGEPPLLQTTPVRKSRRIRATIAFPLALLLIAGAALLWMNHRKPVVAAPRSQAAASAPAGAATTEVTLAVLPFVNMSSDPEQEYFSDGLTEEIRNQLAQVKGLRVTGRTSSFSFKGKNEDLRVIGEKLGVVNMLEGSIRKDGKTLRITAQLINGKDGAHLWSKTYARELKDIFALQEEIAKDVTQALSIKLDVGAMSRAQGGTTNVEAFDKFLACYAFLAQQDVQSKIATVVQLCRDAVTLDPDFVRAWGLLASALQQQMLWRPDLRETLSKEQADVVARLTQLAPEGPFSVGARFRRLVQEHKWAEAEKVAASVPAFRATLLGATGHIGELVELLERERDLEPLSLSASSDLQLFLMASGRAEEARVEYERSKALNGDHVRAEFFGLLRHIAQKDASPAAIRAHFRTYLNNASQPLALDPLLPDKLGDAGATRAILQRAYEDPANQEPMRMVILALYAGHVLQTDLALSALRRSFVDLRGGNFSVLWLAFGPGVRTDPRFKDLLRELGLVDYWRSSGKWGDFCKPLGTDDFECH